MKSEESLKQETTCQGAILKVDIPKPNGDVRTLVVPTVTDRLIQQAIAQALKAYVEPTFSMSSYCFRPNRNAWQAVRQAQQYIQSGKRRVVKMDLEKFFDRMDHDIPIVEIGSDRQRREGAETYTALSGSRNG